MNSVLVIADVRNWAWARKAEQLRRHLDGEEFSVSVAYDTEFQVGVPQGYDLYHTFEIIQFQKIKDQISNSRAVTGITAHVWPTWEDRHGQGTIARWAESARSFHANSVLLQREMEVLLKRPIAYVPNGVDEVFFHRFSDRSSNAALVVGWVGKPNPRKGGGIVQRACAAAGVEFRMVERDCSRALSPEEMRDFYQDIHILAVASDMDGTPNPALEAAACGVAVVSNQIGNMPEFVADGVNGRLIGALQIPPQKPSVDDLAEALRSIDVSTAVRMGEAARATVEAGWTWKRQAENYAAMWREALR